MTTKKDHSEDITKIGPEQLPSFMKDDVDAGVEALTEFVTPPRIKVVQKQSRAELLELFSPGDVILTPMQVSILEIERDNKGRIDANAKMSFNVVPLFFYPEWAVWNPIELIGQDPAIRYRTTDPADPIVVKARNQSLREEPHPQHPNLKIRYVEHLNFVIILMDHPLQGTPVMMSFAKGEWQAGSNWASLIKMRHGPLYGCVFTATVALRSGALGQWYGLNMSNPNGRSSWVDQDTFTITKNLHLEFAEYRRNARLQASLEDEDSTIDATVSTASEEF